jgi:TolB-like protein
MLDRFLKVRMFFGVLFAALLLPFSAHSADVKRVAILPFELHSSEDISYLQRGLLDMLLSRVVRGGGIEVVGSGEVLSLVGGVGGVMGVSRVLELGRGLGVDYVVYGSLTKLGSHVSLDGEVLEVVSGRSVGRLVAEASDLDGVIPQVGRLAGEIRSMVLGEGSGGVSSSVSSGVSGYSGPPPGGYPMPPGGFTGRGRGELFDRSGEPISYGGGGLNPAFIMSYQADRARRGYVKTPELPTDDLQAVDVGDVDGDGQVETVVADEDRVYIFERVLLDTSNPVVVDLRASRAKLLSLDVADVNGNGVAEIYITALEEHGERLVSQVVEYRDGVYRDIAVGLPYFLRVVRSLREGLVLFGQEKRVVAFTERATESLMTPFDRPFRLRWEGGRLVRGEELPLKDDICVLGLTMLDVDHDGVEEYLAFDVRDYLKLFNAQGGVVWVSREPYGRTANYFMRDIGRQLTPNEEPPNLRVWLPPRLLTVDLDGDGFDEVIVCHNYEPLMLMANTRIFTKSAIFSLSWDGLDFMENWRTREMKGYVADYQVKDVDGDRRPELLVGLIYKRGAMDFIKTKASLIGFVLTRKSWRDSTTQGKTL